MVATSLADFFWFDFASQLFKTLYAMRLQRDFATNKGSCRADSENRGMLIK